MARQTKNSKVHIPRALFALLSVFGVVTVVVYELAIISTLEDDSHNNMNLWVDFSKHDDNQSDINLRKEKKGRKGENHSDYRRLREKYDAHFPPSDTERMLQFARFLRKRNYEPTIDTTLHYKVRNCPLYPPDGYPTAWKLLDIVENWNPDDPIPRSRIYQGLCVFDHATELEKAKNYQSAELPFVIRDDPLVLQTVERWAHPMYLRKLLAPLKEQRTEHSSGNHFMYWKRKKQEPQGWTPPTENIKLTYEEWLSKANVTDDKLGVDQPHWYYRLNGKKCKNNDDCTNENKFLFDELPFFRPKESLYMVNPEEERGVNCRFGMKGVIAENHFDSSRNMIVLLGGERRYILAHPDQCKNLALFPAKHPSGRHSAVDWSNPDLDTYPQFKNAMGNEIVLQAGDALYLPTFWFHYIISLELNWQCNARSGMTKHYKEAIHDCGF